MRILTALLVLVLAACATPATQARPTTRLALYRELAACVRSHGYPNLPDPVQNPRTGEVELPEGAPTPPESAMRPCKSIVDRLDSGQQEDQHSPAPLSAEDLAKLKRFAACVRAHGLPEWPDPAADGTFTVSDALARLGKGQLSRYFKNCPEVTRFRVVPQGGGHG